MKWTDVYDIAIELADNYPDDDPQYIRFTDLRAKVISLAHFDDCPTHCSEKILEAIQMAWIEEVQ